VAVNLRNHLPAPFDQGNCESCWAVATATVLTAKYRRSNPGSPFVLSPQFIMDWVHPLNNGAISNGCNRGNQGEAGFYMTWLLNNGFPNLPRLSTYVYMPSQAYLNHARSLAFLNGLVPHNTMNFALVNNVGNSAYVNMAGDQRNTITNNLRDFGPFAIFMNIRRTNRFAFVFAFYANGIINANACAGPLNHIVVLYGHENNGWLIRNSWNIYGHPDIILQGGLLGGGTAQNTCRVLDEVLYFH